MLTENAIINELFQKIDIHSKSQLKMFYLIVVNIVVYILLGALSGGGNELVHGVNNAVFNLAITILLIFLPSPIGKNYIKNKAEASQLYTDISPKYDFYGNWGYKTTFTLGSFDDGSDEFKLVDENMNFTTPIITRNSVLNVSFEKKNENSVNNLYNKMKIIAKDGVLYINNIVTNDVIRIYDIEGNLYHTVSSSEGTFKIKLPVGNVYIIKGIHDTFKIRL